MANRINYQYFQDQFSIVPLNKTVESNLAYRQDIDRYIARYEPECLKLFLGYDIEDTDNFYNLFIAGENTEARMIALKAKIIDPTNFISPIAGYTWWYWIKFHRGSIINTDNPVKTIPAEMTVINDMEQLCASWNYMVDLWQEVHDWLVSESETYPEYSQSANYFEKINKFDI